ncbi:bifunctional RNase H/acid phosphatase [Actinokineospora soli]|uniref:Bifunctional RNase H/acid phosphatase n=1 Tax=Actinokineospora soli TaxID=1048753 RepID=A0ABW2TK37_9PSEU
MTYTWIPRNRNTHADRLANEAMDAAASTPTPPRPAAPEQQTLPVTPVEGQAKATRPSAGGQAKAAATPRSGRGQAGTTDPRSAGGQSATAQPRRPADPHPQADLAHRTSPTSWTGARGEPTRLLLLRHGQTPMSAERRYSGRGDVDLTELGKAQAEAAARRLAKVDGVDATTPIVASPLTRTLSTARSVVTQIGGEVITHPGLIETDFGAWEGLTFTEAAQRDPELHARWLADPSVPAPDGESFDAVHRRVAQARDEILTRFAGRTVIVVSHVTPIKALLRMALDAGPSLLFRLHLDLASLSIAEFYPDGNASVRLVNDISHLG